LPASISHPHCLAQAAYDLPAASAELLKNVPFAAGKPIGQQLRKRFSECDQHNTCEGAALTHGCSKDKNYNTALLSLPGGVVFYHAKMGIDADGSPLSIKNAGPTDQPTTNFRYRLPNSPSVNSDAVPYIVIPQKGFEESLHVVVGDNPAVVFDGQVAYALVADLGPKCKLGEGSIALHEQLGHKVCIARDSKGECTRLHDVGLSQDVLYFIFPFCKDDREWAYPGQYRGTS